MQGLFAFDPLRRWDSTKTLKSSYFRFDSPLFLIVFSNDPPCCPDDDLPLPGRPQNYNNSRRRKHGEMDEITEPARKRLVFD